MAKHPFIIKMNFTGGIPPLIMYLLRTHWEKLTQSPARTTWQSKKDCAAVQPSKTLVKYRHDG